MKQKALNALCFALALACLAVTVIGLRWSAAAAQDDYSDGIEQIDLNTADAADLQRLPGVGPALASAIVDYREANGGFQTVEDLKKVPGIGEKRFESIRDSITIGGLG